MDTQAPSTLIFSTAHLQIGYFRCPVGHPHFQDTGPIVSGHLIVFPRTSVRIRHPGAPPIVANPNVVLFYNRHQRYQRDQLSAQGDHCEWFAFAPTLLLQALQAYDPQVVEHPDHPFSLTHALNTPLLYLRQRQVFDHIVHAAQTGTLPDQLYVEESMLLTLSLLLAHVYQQHPRTTRRLRASTYRQQQEIVHSLCEALTLRFQEKTTLEQLAAMVHFSPYELCRIFHAHAGLSLHQYLNQLRLCAALEALTNPSQDLTELALTLGYNSHSHFTSAFRKTFGITPSMLRATPQRSQNLRKNLIA